MMMKREPERLKEVQAGGSAVEGTEGKK